MAQARSHKAALGDLLLDQVECFTQARKGYSRVRTEEFVRRVVLERERAPKQCLPSGPDGFGLFGRVGEFKFLASRLSCQLLHFVDLSVDGGLVVPSKLEEQGRDFWVGFVTIAALVDSPHRRVV